MSHKKRYTPDIFGWFLWHIFFICHSIIFKFGNKLKGIKKTHLRSKCKLELMFMKHYAPNRCLYIKVAKLRTGVGSAEMSHLQNRCLKRSEVFVKTFFFSFFFEGGGGVGGQGGCERRIEVFVKIQKKKFFFFGGGGGGSGWGVRVDVN